MTLWDYALVAWARPGVSEVCLQLQNQHGQCVALLLWRAWATTEGRQVSGSTARRAINLARLRESKINAPLRAARRALAGAPEGVEAARAAELDAERALLEALEALTPPAAGVRFGGLAPGLATLMAAWNGSRIDALAGALASALRR